MDSELKPIGILNIPDELITLILSSNILSMQDLFAVCLTCSRLQRFINDEYVWEQKFKNR